MTTATGSSPSIRPSNIMSAADTRLANMSFAQKVADQRLARSQERSRWYTLSEKERSDILFPAPRKIQFDYYSATPEQTRQTESHFKGEAMHWRDGAMSRDIKTSQLTDMDKSNPKHLPGDRPAHRPWHVGGAGFERIARPGPGTRPGNNEGFFAEKIGQRAAVDQHVNSLAEVNQNVDMSITDEK
jgi:hypothetical protein